MEENAAMIRNYLSSSIEPARLPEKALCMSKELDPLISKSAPISSSVEVQHAENASGRQQIPLLLYKVNGGLFHSELSKFADSIVVPKLSAPQMEQPHARSHSELNVDSTVVHFSIDQQQEQLNTSIRSSEQPIFDNDVTSAKAAWSVYYKQNIHPCDHNNITPSGKSTWRRGEYHLKQKSNGDQDLILNRPERPLVVKEYTVNQNLFRKYARDHTISIDDNELEEVQVELSKRIHLLRGETSAG